MTTSPAAAPVARARRAFWILLVVSVLALGALSDALAAPASPATGLRVAASGVLLVVSLTLAARVLRAVDHATSRPRHVSRSSGPRERHPSGRTPR